MPETGRVFDNNLLEILLIHFSSHSQINQPDHLGVTPLHLAAGCGNLPAVKSLLEAGANINALDNGNDTPLDALCDRLYTVVSNSAQTTTTEAGIPAMSSTIETYVYFSINDYLKSQGGLSGAQMKEEGASIPKLGHVSILIHSIQIY